MAEKESSVGKGKLVRTRRGHGRKKSRKRDMHHASDLPASQAVFKPLDESTADFTSDTIEPDLVPNEPLQEAVNPLDLLNALPRESILLPFLDSNALLEKMDQIAERKHMLRNVSFKGDCSVLTQLLSHLKHYDENPSLAHALKHQIQFLKQFNFRISQLRKWLEAWDFHDLHAGIQESIIHLKKHIYQYQLEYQPFIENLKMMPFQKNLKTSFWDNIVSWFHQKKAQPSMLDFISHNVGMLQHSKERTIEQIEDLLNELAIIQSGLNPSEHIVNELTNGVYNEQEIVDLTFGIMHQIPIRELLYLTLNAYDDAHKEGKQCLLQFLLGILKADSHGSLLDCDGSAPEWDAEIGQLDIRVQDEKETLILNDIKVHYKMIARTKREGYKDFLNQVEQASIPLYDLTEHLKNQYSEYEKQFVSLRHLIRAAYDILNRLTAKSLGKGHQVEYIQIMQKIQSRIPTPQHQELYNVFDALLNQKITQNILVVPDWAHIEEQNEPSREFDTKESTLIQNLEKIANGSIQPQSRKKMITIVIRLLHSEIQKIFTTFSLTEMSKSLHQEKPNPFVKKQLTLENALSAFIPDLLLYKISSPKTPRVNLEQTHQLALFLIDVFKEAVYTQKGHVAYIIQNGFAHESLKALPWFQDLFPVSNELSSLANQSFPELHVIFKELERLNDFFKTSYKYLSIGTYISKCANLQKRIAQENPELEGFQGTVKKRLMYSHHYPPSKSFQEILSELEQKTIRLSRGLMITVEALEAMSLSQLFERLQDSNQQQLPLHVFQKAAVLDPEKALARMVESVMHKIGSATPPSPAMLMGIVNGLGNNRAFTKSDQLCAQIIQAWQLRLMGFINSHEMQSSQAEQLRDDVLKLKITQQVFLSENRLCAKAYEDLIAAFQEKVPSNESQYGEAYQKTLAHYLSGTQSERITLPSKTDNLVGQDVEPAIDFDLLEEESHPEVIGFAETWNVFQQMASNVIASPPFSYKNIKDTIMSAFPWAVSDPNELNIKPITLNLLDVNPNVQAFVQKEVTDLIFLALDIIGKLAGTHGEMSLHNLEQIDHIIMVLDKVSTLLHDTDTLQTEKSISNFLQMVQNNSSMLKEVNQLLYQKLTHQLPFSQEEVIIANNKVNNLLRMNEGERNRHLEAQDYKETGTSLLTPQISEAFLDNTEPETQAEIDEWALLAAQASKEAGLDLERGSDTSPLTKKS